MISAFRRWANKPLDRDKARHALLINLFGTPGLGSLVAGRRIAGSVQLLLAGVGCGLLLGWWLRVLIIFYSLMSWDAPSTEPDLRHGLWKTGAALFGAAWLWALGTSISLYREARTNTERAMREAGNQPPVIAEHDAQR